MVHAVGTQNMTKDVDLRPSFGPVIGILPSAIILVQGLGKKLRMGKMIDGIDIDGLVIFGI